MTDDNTADAVEAQHDDRRAAHDERDGFGCLTAADAGFPPLSDEPGKRHRCVCGRHWEIREVAGFVVWQPVGETLGEESEPAESRPSAPHSGAPAFWVEPEDVAALPTAARRIIAHWLTQRAKGMDNSWVSPAESSAAASALRGVAVDLIDPLAEDSTIDHAQHVLAELAHDKAVPDVGGEPTGLLRLGTATYVDVRYHSAALDEIYWLRAALAHEATVRRIDLERRTYPPGRRRVGEEAIERMAAAARGDCARVYRAAGVDNKAALAAVDAPECLTQTDWVRHVNRSSTDAEASDAGTQGVRA